jgi:hypothetical protein
LLAYGIFKVIYAPRKAFKEIIEKPRYLGPILVIVLFVLANTGSVYTLVAKTRVEQTLPAPKPLDSGLYFLDAWTENSSLWTSTSGVTIKDNYDDYVNGNESIEFLAFNTSQISVQLSDIEPVDCSGSNGYNELSFRVKWTSPADRPENTTIHLFSTNSSDYFYYNLTQTLMDIRATNNTWNNLTVPLATSDWLRSDSGADWGNITGLQLELAWPYTTNVTLLLDGLFFRGVFKSPIETSALRYVTDYSLVSFMQFVVQWVVLGLLIYLMTRAFHAKTTWKPLLILVGFALITLVVQAIVNTIAYATSPTINYTLESLGDVSGESQVAKSKLSQDTLLLSQITGYTMIAVIIWTVALCALATRSVTEFSWSKSLLIATVAYFVTVLIQNFIFGV